MKHVLMVAYHFPPFAKSSGIQRTLRFVQHLPAFGWQPIVLTARAGAYEQTSNDLLSEIPAGVVVERAFALDAARHLSIRGRYPTALAKPDRWMTWQFGAVPAGMALVRKWRPAVIWSTYPIATAHVIGSALHRRSALPWIADFRDPMAQEGYPENPEIWQSFKRIETRTVGEARFSIFTTPSAARMYCERYPQIANRVQLIENGFDEESFSSLPDDARTPLVPGTLTLLHSGIVYPSERDPTQLFAAVQQLAAARKITPQRLRLRFRASAHEPNLQALARTYAIEPFIELLPPVPYRTALEEMVRADGLLVLQAANCNEQIPAKIYEYLRARRPILGLTDPKGDTAYVLREAGVDAIAPLDSCTQIAGMLERFIADIDHQRAALPRDECVDGASRRGRAEALARLLDRASTA